MKKRAGERGVSTITAAFFVLPILYLVFSLTLDLNAFTVERERLQSVLDSAALHGVRQLPFNDQALDGARAMLSQGEGAGAARVVIEDDSVAVFLERFARLSFAGLLGIEARVPYSLYARARTVPADVFVAIDLGAYLAPDAASGESWGAPGEWPAARYFETFPYQPAPPLDSRVLTAQCFNPALSTVKRVGGRIFEYFARFAHNRVGLGVYPGSGVDLDLVHRLGDRPEVAVDFPRYQNRYVQSVDCAAAAEEETWAEQYRLPAPLFPGATSGGALSSSWVGSGRTFDEDQLPFLTPRESVWINAVRAATVTSAGIGDTAAVINTIGSHIIGVSPDADRGGLVGEVSRIGVIVAGDVPRRGAARFPDPIVSEALSRSFAGIRGAAEEHRLHVRLYYLYFAHPGAPEDRDRVEEVRRFFEAQYGRGEGWSVDAAPLFARDGDALLGEAAPAVLLARQRGVLAR